MGSYQRVLASILVSGEMFTVLAYVFSLLCLYFPGINLAGSRMFSTCCCIWRFFCHSRLSQFIRRLRRKYSVVTTPQLKRQATLYCSNTVLSRVTQNSLFLYAHRHTVTQLLTNSLTLTLTLTHTHTHTHTKINIIDERKDQMYG